MELEDISEFSNLDDIGLALTGKYGQDSNNNYKIIAIKNVAFLFTYTSGLTITVELPNHKAFSFTDDTGRHTVNENTNKVSVTGIATLIMSLK